MYFSLSDGSLACSECKAEGEYAAINKTVLSALRHIVFSEFKNLYAFEIPEKDANLLSIVTVKYITLQTEFNFSALQFLVLPIPI